MRDEPDPPRKFYELKEPEFERVNETGAADAAPVPSLPPAPVSRSPINPSDQTPANRDNDVHAILRANQAKDVAAGLYEVKPRPRRQSKRKRDYWILVLAGNAVLLTLLWLLIGSGGGWGAVIMLVSLGAGVVIYNVGLAWVMWQVMDDY